MIGNAFRVRSGFLQHEEFSERRLFPRASVMITVTDQILAGWEKRYPQYAAKYRLLWNGFDPDEPFPAPAPEPNAPLTITHVGNIYGHRHPQHFLSSIERLIDAGKLNPSGIRVNLVGPLREPPEVKPLSSFKRLLEWGVLTFDGVNVPRTESLQCMAKADYLLAIDINELNVSHSMPAKMFDYARANRPIIGLVPHNSIIERVLRQAEVEALFLYPDDSPEMQDRKLLEFISLPRRESIANEWFRQTFDGRRQAGALAELIRSL